MIKFLSLIWITTISLATEFDFKLSNNSYLELSCQNENPIKNLYFKSKSKQLKVIDKFHCFNTSKTGLVYGGLFHAVKVTPILDRPYPEQKVEGWWENNKEDIRICDYNLKVEKNILTAELKEIKTENIEYSR
ncbi:MAG: hypothetical protein NXH75_03515, partial [Halobacteriovoraceae bacterium]|nr:hypothetical protein [Halobacteriovoraceae bacterium]